MVKLRKGKILNSGLILDKLIEELDKTGPGQNLDSILDLAKTRNSIKDTYKKDDVNMEKINHNVL